MQNINISDKNLVAKVKAAAKSKQNLEWWLVRILRIKKSLGGHYLFSSADLTSARGGERLWI